MVPMSKLYNTKSNIVKGLIHFFASSGLNLSIPQKKMLPFIILGMIDSESIVTANIAKTFKFSFFSSNNDSNQRRIRRFFSNPNFDIYSFYNTIIKHIISNIKSIKHSKIIITMDHMYTSNNFVILVFTLKLGKQGIPIWFKCAKCKNINHSPILLNTKKQLFNQQFIINSVKEVMSLFKDISSDSKIIFLADRWFDNFYLMKFINDSGHYFAIRTKAKTNKRYTIFDTKEKHMVTKLFKDLKPKIHSSLYLDNIFIGKLNFKCNLAISRGKISDDPWYILTNLNSQDAIRTYSHRYGSIEHVFKSQKTNGFYLEDTKTKNLKAFETMYGLCCFSHLWLSIIGADYSKNYKHIKNRLNIRFTKKVGNKTERILSMFKLGLTIFKTLIDSHINLPIKCNLQLYL